MLIIFSGKKLSALSTHQKFSEENSTAKNSTGWGWGLASYRAAPAIGRKKAE